MKPIIIKTQDGVHADITLAEINQLIEDAYNQGVLDTEAALKPVYAPPIHWEQEYDSDEIYEIPHFKDLFGEGEIK
jgi:hypothetical protein